MSIAEQYEDFIATLEEKGIPNPRVLAPAIAVILILAIGFFALSGGIPGVTQQGGDASKESLSLTVRDSATNAGVNRAAVTLYFADGQSKVAYTDSSGVVSFTGLASAGVRVKVTAVNYNDYASDLAAGTSVLTLTSLITAPDQTTVLVAVRDSQDNDVQGAFVLLSNENGETLASQLSNSFGEATLKIDSTKIPGVGNLRVELSGYKTVQRMISSSELQDTVNVLLESASEQNFEEQGDGTLTVYVTDEYGDAVSGATASIADYYTGRILRSAKTASDGTASFTKIAFGTTFSLLVKHSAFEDYAADEQDFSSAYAEFYASLTKKTEPDANALSIEVVDRQGAAIEYAEVSVYDRASRALLATQVTDDEGKTIFSAARGKTLFLTASADGFLPGVIEVAQAGETKKISLESEAAGNFVDVPVSIKIEGEPAANAFVAVYRADGFPLGVPQQNADADGVAEFRLPARLKNNVYEAYAAASLDALHGKSDLVTVVEGVELFISLQPDPAILRVEARDVSTNSSVKGALFVIKPSVGESLSCTSNLNANDSYCEIAVAPNQEFVVTASAVDYLPATTSSVVLAPNEKATLSIRVYPLALARGASVRFEGLYDAKGRNVKEVANAAFYEARFLATVPRTAEQSFFFVSVGDAATADEDFAAIYSFDVDAVKFVYSGVSASDDCAASESALNAETEESTGTASETIDGLKKWVNFELPKNFVGTKEFALQVYVKSNAKANARLTFHSRVAGVSGGAPFFSPASDDVLASVMQTLDSGAAVSAGDFCDAETRSDSVKVSRNLLYCDDAGLCSSMVFEDENGAQTQGSFSTQVGKQFFLAYEIASEDKEISSLTVKTGKAIEFLGKEIVALNMSSFADDEENAGQTISARAQPGERLTGVLKFKALRSSANSAVTLFVNYADRSEQAGQIQNSVTVTGTNDFRVTVTPQTLVAGLTENVRATVKDEFGETLQDANVLFYECDGSPLNGQELQIQGDGSVNRGADGVYKARLAAAAVGVIGVRVSREGFKTFDDCPIEVFAGEFLSVEPENLVINGDSSTPGGLTKEVTVYSSLPVRSRVSTTVECSERGSAYDVQSVAAPLYVSPQSFYLKDSTKAQVIVNENASGEFDCYINFRAEINAKNVFVATVYARATLTTPPVIDYCPIDAGYKCISPINVPSNCFPQPQYECKAASGSGVSSTNICAVCDYGTHTFPTQFNLTVGETKSSASQTEEIALDSKPKCAIEGFESTSSNSGSNDYWSYQPNYYSAQSPYGNAGAQQFDYQNYYGSAYGGAGAYGSSGYGTGYGTTGYGTTASGYGTATGSASGGVNFGTGYGSGYGYGSNAMGYGYGTGAQGTYCPSTLNTQSMYGSYYSNSYSSPSSTSYPAGNTQSCQYPYVCQSGASSYCSFTASGYGSSMGYSSYGTACAYPAICTNPSGCPYLSSSSSYGTNYGNAYNYAYNKPPVSVSVSSCTASELSVTAEYTGYDYYYNSAMGGEQNGFLVVTWKGETKKIPVTVKVAAPSQLTRVPQYPIPYTPSMPVACLPQIGSGAKAEGLNELGLPDNVEVKINAFTGKGEYDQKIDLTSGVLCKNFKVDEKEGDITSEKCTSTQFAFKIAYKKKSGAKDPAFKDVSDSGSYVAVITGYNVAQPQEYSIDVVTDDLVKDGKVTLYKDQLYWDKSGEKDYLEKAKCTVSGGAGFKVSCKNNILNVSWDGAAAGTATVKITNAADFNVREIPVEAKMEKRTGFENLNGYYTKDKKVVVTGLPPEAKSVKINVCSDAECKNVVKTLEGDVKEGKIEIPFELKDAFSGASELQFATDYYFQVVGVKLGDAKDFEKLTSTPEKLEVYDSNADTITSKLETKPKDQIITVGTGCFSDKDCPEGQTCHKAPGAASTDEGTCIASAPLATTNILETFNFLFVQKSPGIKLGGTFTDPGNKWVKYSLELYAKLPDQQVPLVKQEKQDATKILDNPTATLRYKARYGVTIPLDKTINDFFYNLKTSGSTELPPVYAKITAFDASGAVIGELTAPVSGNEASVTSMFASVYNINSGPAATGEAASIYWLSARQRVKIVFPSKGSQTGWLTLGDKEYKFKLTRMLKPNWGNLLLGVLPLGPIIYGVTSRGFTLKPRYSEAILLSVSGNDFGEYQYDCLSLTAGLSLEGKQILLEKNKRATCKAAGLNFKATEWNGQGDANGALGLEYARGKATVEVWID